MTLNMTISKRDTQFNDHSIMNDLGIMTLDGSAECRYADCHYDECRGAK